MRSLKSRLIALWALSLLSSLVLGLLLVDLSQRSTEARLGRTQAVLARACDLIRDRYAFYTTGAPTLAAPDPAFRRDLAALLDIALSRQPGVAGGIWSASDGALASSDRTEAGTDSGADSGAAIAAINAAALRDDRTVARTIADGDDTTLLAACPLDGPLDGVTAWTRSRIRAETGLASLQSGLIALFALLLLSSILLGRTLLVWGRQIRTIEATLAPDDGDADLPPLPRSGERELDRIVDALNHAGARLAQARRAAAYMAARAAQSERLAALGRIAAGVAHEIRNPLAAARLQGENALAGDDRRRRDGIADMLGQLDRLDALVSELLAMTQRVDPAPTAVALPAFLAATAARHADTAAARALTLTTAADTETACLDPAIATRILDNLLSNAIRHAAPAGTVTLAAHGTPGLVTITVADDGAGIPPDMAGRLFEPFVTSRADGTGLGLAIARELADAHGGRLVLRETADLTIFALELPQE